MFQNLESLDIVELSTQECLKTKGGHCGFWCQVGQWLGSAFSVGCNGGTYGWGDIPPA